MSRKTEQITSLGVLAWLGVLLGVLSVELLDLGWQPVWVPFAWTAAFMGLSAATRLGLRQAVGAVDGRIWERCIVGVVVAGLAWRLATVSLPMEMLLLEALRNALLAAIAIPAVSAVRHVGAAAMGMSLFLVLAASVLGDGVGIVMTAVAFATVGSAWLATQQNQMRLRLSPGAAGAMAIVGFGSAAAAWGVHGDPAARAAGVLPAWINSSGGDHSGNDAARSGVGDGPDQLAGPNGDAGFDRSEFFCETDGQCLYDAFLEAYGDPLPTGTIDRSQWLTLNEGQIAEQRNIDLRNGRDQNETPSRQFSIRRKPGAAAVSPDAVLWIEAEMDAFPLRLPVLAFDHYHGGHWHEEPEQPVQTAMDNADADGWFMPVDQPAGKAWGGERRITVSTGTFDSNVLPLPGGLTKFRMGQVKRSDLFGSATEPMLRMSRRSLPDGSVLEAAYRPAWRAALLDEKLATVEPVADHPASAELARKWAGEHPRGWQQVEAVIAGLRAHGRYDPGYSAAEAQHDHNHGCPIETFLHDTRCGDTYHFASAAVLMLRSLGYDARLAGGYYVDTDAIDADSGKAIVTRRSAHVWPQVRLALEAGAHSSRGETGGIARGGQWIDLEPTPGFSIADGSPTASHQFATIARNAGDWLVAHLPHLTLITLLGIALVTFRRFLLDIVDSTWWRLRLNSGSDRQVVLRSLGLLERRARRARRARPVNQSPGRWLGSEPLHQPIATLVDWAMHAPPDFPAPAAICIRSHCRDAVRLRRSKVGRHSPPQLELA